MQYRPQLSLKGRALAFLARREYSRAELRQKLLKYTEHAEEVENVLDALQAQKWLSDERFAEQLVHKRSARHGATRILSELKQHALEPEQLVEFSEALLQTEFARAHTVWKKKFNNTLPETAQQRGKQARFLAMRGFAQSVIQRIFRGEQPEAE